MPENHPLSSSPGRGAPPRRGVRAAFDRVFQGRDGGPPDLDEMWRDFKRRIAAFFGNYARTVDAGWGWRLPYPFEEHEIVPVTQLQTAEIGRSTINTATGLRDSAMLTQD